MVKVRTYNTINTYLQPLQLGHSLILLLRGTKEAPQRLRRAGEALADANDLAQARVHELRHRQQPQRVASGRGVEDDAGKARILLAPHKLHHLQQKSRL